MNPLRPQAQFRVRAVYYTPMLKLLGVNVPGSSTSIIPGSAPLVVASSTENPLASLTQDITPETLTRLPVKHLRELVEGINAVNEERLSKSGKKAELIQRIATSPHKEQAVQQFLQDKDCAEQRKHECIKRKLQQSKIQIALI